MKTFTFLSKLAAMILVLFIENSYAGGVAHEYEIMQVDINKLKFELLAIDEDNPYLTCRSIKVLVSLQDSWWSWVPIIGMDDTLKKSSIIAFEYLMEKGNNNESIYFGEISKGLEKIEGGNCAYLSKGLSLEMIPSIDQDGVFSYFDLE